MDTKDIRYFMRCYETLSMNKASKELFITAQGLTKAMDKLESELKVRLFTRSPKGLVPTEAGAYFYRHCGEILNRLQDLEMTMQQIAESEKTFRIGYACGALNILGLDTLENFRRNVSDYRISWEEGSNEEIKSKLRRGNLDYAFVIGQVADPGFDEQLLFSRKLSAIVYPGHAFYERDVLSMQDLRGEKLITLNEKYQTYYNILQRCADFGFTPDIAVRTMQSSLIYRFCSEKMGIGIDADIHQKDYLEKGLKLITIEDSIPWSIYGSCRKERSNDQIVSLLLQTIAARSPMGLQCPSNRV